MNTKKKILITGAAGFIGSALVQKLLTEDFDVVVDGNIIPSENEGDIQDDQRFNTEKHHKQQHKF